MIQRLFSASMFRVILTCALVALGWGNWQKLDGRPLMDGTTCPSADVGIDTQIDPRAGSADASCAFSNSQVTDGL